MLCVWWKKIIIIWFFFKYPRLCANWVPGKSGSGALYRLPPLFGPARTGQSCCRETCHCGPALPMSCRWGPALPAGKPTSCYRESWRCGPAFSAVSLRPVAGDQPCLPVILHPVFEDQLKILPVRLYFLAPVTSLAVCTFNSYIIKNNYK